MSRLKYFVLFVLFCGAACGSVFWQEHKIPRIAVVDIDKVFAQSNKVFALKEVNNAKLDELSSWLDKAKLTIQNEKDKTKKQDLIAQYQDLARQKNPLFVTNMMKKCKQLKRTLAKLSIALPMSKTVQLCFSKPVFFAAASILRRWSSPTSSKQNNLLEKLTFFCFLAPIIVAAKGG